MDSEYQSHGPCFGTARYLSQPLLTHVSVVKDH